jgi:hypothetical protein
MKITVVKKGSEKVKAVTICPWMVEAPSESNEQK